MAKSILPTEASMNDKVPEKKPIKHTLYGVSKEAQEAYENFLDTLKTEFEENMNSKPVKTEEMTDFDLLHTVGLGAFGRVVLIKHKKISKYYAMKIQDKLFIMNNNILTQILTEKKVMQSIRFPFVVTLEHTFKDNNYVYFAMPFLLGGDLWGQIKKLERLEEDLTKFYATQVILALEYLHHLDILHRDIKPENIMIDKTGYLKIADFGFCKIVTERTFTICGTPEYIAPEIILQKGYSKAVDWWSFGILLYEMTAGYPPFYSRDPMKLFEKIVAGKFLFRDGCFSNDLKDLIYHILQVDLTKRLGNLKDGVCDFKNHRWFFGICWTDILNRKVTPPFIPKTKAAGDTSNFDRFEEETLRCTQVCIYENEFSDF